MNYLIGCTLALAAIRSSLPMAFLLSVRLAE